MIFTNRQKTAIRKAMLERLKLSSCEKFLIQEIMEDPETGEPHAKLMIRAKQKDYEYRVYPLGQNAEYRVVGPLNPCRNCPEREMFQLDSPMYLKGVLQIAKMGARWTE